MSFRNNIAGWFSGGAVAAPSSGPDVNRVAEWESALQQQRLPSFVATRLAAAPPARCPGSRR